MFILTKSHSESFIVRVNYTNPENDILFRPEPRWDCSNNKQVDFHNVIILQALKLDGHWIMFELVKKSDYKPDLK